MVTADPNGVAASPVARSWLPRDVLPSMAAKSGRLGQVLAHPSGESRREHGWIDAVHQDCQPAVARYAVFERQMAAQKVQVRLAPNRI